MKDDFYIWLLRIICRHFVRQGHLHQYKIQKYYSLMWDAARKEFYEDNDESLKSYLRERFEDALSIEPTKYL